MTLLRKWHLITIRYLHIRTYLRASPSNPLIFPLTTVPCGLHKVWSRLSTFFRLPTFFYTTLNIHKNFTKTHFYSFLFISFLTIHIQAQNLITSAITSTMLPPTVIRSCPSADNDFQPLSEYQTHTPETFFDGKPILYFHDENVKAWISAEKYEDLFFFSKPSADDETSLNPTPPESYALENNGGSHFHEESVEAFVASRWDLSCRIHSMYLVVYN